MMQRRSKRNTFILHSRGRPVGGGGLDGIVTPRVVRGEQGFSFPRLRKHLCAILSLFCDARCDRHNVFCQ